MNFQRHDMVYDILEDNSCDYEKLQQKFSNAHPSVDDLTARDGGITDFSFCTSTGNANPGRIQKITSAMTVLASLMLARAIVRVSFTSIRSL